MKRSLFFLLCIFFAAYSVCAQNIFPAEREGLWGYVDKHGKWKIQPQYHYAGEFHDGLACVMKYFDHNKSIVKLYGFINKKGETVIPLEYNYASDFHQGIAIVGMLPGTHWESWNQGKSWNYGATTSNLMELQFINKEGRLSKIDDRFHYAEYCPNDSIRLVKCVFVSRIYSFKDSEKAVVTKEYQESKISRSIIKNSFYDKCILAGFSKTNDDLDNQLEAINCLNTDDFMWTSSQDGIIYCKTNQRLDVVSETIDRASLKHSKLKPKSHWGMWGLVNDFENWIVPAKFDYIKEDNERGVLMGHFRVHGSTGWGIIDTLGNEKIPMVYDDIWSIDDHFSVIKKDGNTGIINDKWETIVPPNMQRRDIHVYRKYNRITYKVCDTLCHMTDTSGNLIQKAYAFTWQINEKVIVYMDDLDKYGLMGLDGYVVLQPNYDDLYIYDSFVKTSQRATETVGAVSFDGKVILPCNYFFIRPIGNLIHVIEHKGDSSGSLFNLDGKQLIDQNGQPLIIKYISAVNGNSIISVETKAGFILMTIDGVRINDFCYSKVDYDKKELMFMATRNDSTNGKVIDIFDDSNGKLVKTIKN